MRNSGPRLAVRRECWRLVRQGLAVVEAARRVDVAESTGLRWYREAGGMTPLSLSEPSGRYLNLQERTVIYVGVVAGLRVRTIARQLGRSARRVSKEITRNTRTRPNRGPEPYQQPRTRGSTCSRRTALS